MSTEEEPGAETSPGPSGTEDGAPTPSPPSPRTRLAEVVQRLVPRQPEYDPTPGRRIYLLGAFVFRRCFIEDRAWSLAASLTISTLLSTIPTFGVALFFVGLMDPVAGSDRLAELFGTVFPDTGQADIVADQVLRLASNVTMKNLGAWGFGVALVIAFVLFQTLEKTFNRIWRSTRNRNLLVKFTMFYTLATLGPLIVLFSLAQPFMPDMSRTLGTPILTTTLGLWILNRFLPFAEVRLSSAFVGGLVSAILFELGKFGFGIYVTRFALSTYEGLYGSSLAILPMFVVWSQLSWMVILLGAEIAFVVQHRRSIALLGYMNRYVLDRLAMQRPSGRTAARIMLAIADHYARRCVGHTPDDLAERFGLGLDTVTEILSRLRRAELVAEVDDPRHTLVPARPLDQIHVIEVLELFDRDQARDARDDRLSRVFAEFDLSRQRMLAATTYADLVEMERQSEPSRPGPPGVVSTSAPGPRGA